MEAPPFPEAPPLPDAPARPFRDGTLQAPSATARAPMGPHRCWQARFRQEYACTAFHREGAARSLLMHATNVGASVYFGDCGLRTADGMPCLIGRVALMTDDKAAGRKPTDAMRPAQHLRAAMFVVERAAVEVIQRGRGAKGAYILDGRLRLRTTLCSLSSRRSHPILRRGVLARICRRLRTTIFESPVVGSRKLSHRGDVALRRSILGRRRSAAGRRDAMCWAGPRWPPRAAGARGPTGGHAHARAILS